MKEYTGKTVEEALESASAETGVSIDELIYVVSEEKKGIFSKKATIQVFGIEDAVQYGEEYLKNVLESLGIENVEITTTVNDAQIIRMGLNSSRNPVIIGKNGRTLQALNDLVRLAVNTKYKKRFHILLDVADYKDNKYSKIIQIAKRAAKSVLKTHFDVQLDPMTSDERRIIHNALSNWDNIATESTGTGAKRAIVIKYTGSEGSRGVKNVNSLPKGKPQKNKRFNKKEVVGDPDSFYAAHHQEETEEVKNDFDTEE